MDGPGNEPVNGFIIHIIHATEEQEKPEERNQPVQQAVLVDTCGGHTSCSSLLENVFSHSSTVERRH